MSDTFKRSEGLKLEDVSNDFNKQAAIFKEDYDAKKGFIVSDSIKENQAGGRFSNYQVAAITNLKSMVKEVESIRRGGKTDPAIDMSFGDYVHAKLGIPPDAQGGFKGLFNYLGIQDRNTIQKLMTMPEFDPEFKWLVPELVRDAIRTGFLADPLWDTIIASDTFTNEASVVVPQIKVADTPVYRLGEAETIPFGNMTFGEKTIRFYKVGTGVELSDEVIQFVNLDTLSEYLASVGVAITQGLNTLAVQTLVNGDLGQGNAASVIGVENIAAFDYDNDILRLAIRMGLLGYSVQHIIANEEPAREILVLPEMKGFDGPTTLASASIRIGRSVPRNFEILPSGVMPVADQLLWLDVQRALHKYTSRALFIESERLIQTQMNMTVATITTGFSKFMRDASIIMDKSLAFSGNGFPAFMDPTSFMVRDWLNK